jgi:hypothetical protein
MTTRRTLIVCALLVGACDAEPLVIRNEAEIPPWFDGDGDGIPDADELNGSYGYYSDPEDPDTDNDGLTDGDEYLITNTDPNAVDHDFDGLTDYEEYALYGTDPRSPDSDLDGLLDLDELMTHGTSPIDEDSDGDGLRDGDELDLYDCDPLDRDTDGDGLFDGQEVGRGTDPRSLDSDGDGLSDYDEVDLYKTDPTLSDTDIDGLDDGVELFETGTDPLAFDTDLDGLSDGAEVQLGTNYFLFDTDGDGLSDGTEVNEFGSDPRLRDTDGDSLSDFAEYNLGTDPNSIDTDGDMLSDVVEVTDSLTDPLQADTDFDGLDDGHELNVTLTDPLVADTDGDLLLDGEEVDVHLTDPLDPDTDADGLIDGAELLVFESNPLNPDTDGDELSDGLEANLYITQPADPDTDQDGLDDGFEVMVSFTDPLVADMDVDGVTDGDEWLLYASDPFHPDSDGDGLLDGDEALVWGTDLASADSDGGGRPDAAEVARGDDPLDPSDDDACTYPETDVVHTPFVSQPEQVPAPVYARLHWSGIQVGSHFEDSSQGTARFEIELLDASRNPACTITYDLSGGAAPHQHEVYTTEGGGDFWQPVSLELDDSVTDCLAYGGADLRQRLAPIPWAVALGPLDTIAQELEADVLDAGGDWANDWAPYVLGAFVHLEDGVLLETGYAFLYEATCDNVTTGGGGALTPVPAPVDGIPDHFMEVTGTHLFTVPELLQIADLAVADPYFQPVCLVELPETPVRGDGSCDEPFVVDLTQKVIGSSVTVSTGIGGVSESLPDGECTDNQRDVVFRVLLPPDAGLEASVGHLTENGPQPHLVLLEKGTCDDTYVNACSAPDQPGNLDSCDVLRVEEEDLVGGAALITVSEETATGSDYTLTLRAL